MSNKRYQRGRAFEYLAKKDLEREGWTVIRAAGSHGPYDLVAFKHNEPVRAIQIKAIVGEAGLKSLQRAFRPDYFQHYNEELWIRYQGKWNVSR